MSPGIKSEMRHRDEVGRRPRSNERHNLQHPTLLHPRSAPACARALFVEGLSRCVCRLWCANPESQMRAPQLMYRKDKCVACGACLTACPRGAIAMGTDVRKYIPIEHSAPAAWRAAYRSVRQMPAKSAAILLPPETVHEVQEDRLFYRG